MVFGVGVVSKVNFEEKAVGDVGRVGIEVDPMKRGSRLEEGTLVVVVVVRRMAEVFGNVRRKGREGSREVKFVKTDREVSFKRRDAG